MKAFVGHSFDEKDKTLVESIICFLEKQGVDCATGEKAENKSVSGKVRERIEANPIFIGIFTTGEEIKTVQSFAQVSSELFNSLFIRKKQSILYTTSNWVIQESGYALGKGKSVIFMVEEGISRFPELQGDMEIIPFNRGALDTALMKLIQMLLAVGSIDLSRVDITQQSVSSELTKGKTEEMPTEAKKPKWIHCFELLSKQDFDEAEKVLQEAVKDDESKEYSFLLQGLFLRKKYCAGHLGSLRKLEELYSSTKEFDIGIQLGLAHTFVGKFEDARAVYGRVLVDTSNVTNKVTCQVRIAETFSEEGRLTEAVGVLLKALNSVEFRVVKDAVFEILTSLVGVTDGKDDFLYFAFAEKLLDVNPVETAVRFNVAYKYSNNGKEDLAVYHYKKLIAVKEDSTALNNIGVSYNSLGMKSKAVNCYEKARDGKLTLAHSNLANKYLEEGFTKVAEELLHQADEFSKEGIEVHENIGLARKRMKEMLEKENEKEAEVLKSAEKARAFNIRHSDAICRDAGLIDISGVWKLGEWGTVKIVFDKSTVCYVGTGILEVEESASLGLSALLPFGSAPQKQIKKFNVELKVTLLNRGGSYSLIVKDEATGGRSSLLSFGNERHNAKGQIIVAEDGRSFDVLEEGKERKFLKWDFVG